MFSIQEDLPFRDPGPGASSGAMATFRHHVVFGTRKQSKRTWTHSGHAGASGEDGIPAERGVTGMRPWPAPGDRQAGAKGQHYWKPGQHGLRGHQGTSLSPSIHKGAVATSSSSISEGTRRIERKEVTVFRFLSKAQRFVTSCFLLKGCSPEKCDLLPHIQKMAVWITA